ncbi:Sodium/hydrogen exchanger family-domain-containing protein [Thelephora terrestris]|uniref:Sodium/hydrogen exchanger family-domain-containing protein n=1 Tax=Thelephora terrestris TaxID=56493 RepID=A0A9P6HAW2_9AGAM|nr:Sodium/hydrogen exchanger family-domain-containing protein [Thelephora terrestris]
MPPSGFSQPILDIASALWHKREATEQGGLLSGKDPTAYNPSDPIRLWIIQVGIIILTSQLLSLGLAKIRQPKVIAEVLGGILLGPTAFGRIPGFTEHIFPSQSIPYLSLVANIGLALFLFLVGLEIDAGVISRNARLSMTVAVAGIVVPFGMGAGLSVPLYHHFVDQAVQFTHFMLFAGVAFSITAFPVLCRILTELKLLDTTVGIVVLSAGVGNDIVGWTLLALSVALVNAGSGLTALWILLTCVGWTLFLLLVVKKLVLWVAVQTGSINNGPSKSFMTFVILLMFGSAFFTDVIGVHAIFGAFVTGLIVPRQGNLAIIMTEKLEDVVSIIFLPLYFTISGLSTNLGLLNTGVIWGYTIAICATSYIGKFGGCSIAARIAGFTWRESTTIGSLMSCKGLVELIVLNVGLSAGILDQRVFSMFVLEAMVLTFMTTPAVTILYPPHLRVRVTSTGQNFNNVDGEEARNQPRTPRTRASGSVRSDDTKWKSRFTVVLDKVEHLPAMMSLTQLIHPSPPPPPPPQYSSAHSSISSLRLSARRGVNVDALRLIELSDRVSAVMKGSAAETLVRTDPTLEIYRTFGDINGVDVTTSLAIVAFDDLAVSVVDHARNNLSHLVLLPWLPPTHEQDPHKDPTPDPLALPAHHHSNVNPFDALFKATHGGATSTSVVHSQFVREVFSLCTNIDVALYIDPVARSPGDVFRKSASYHLVCPFFGGPDDRMTLEWVVQLCTSTRISATVIRIRKEDIVEEIREPAEAHTGPPVEKPQGIPIIEHPTLQHTIASPMDTVYAQHNTQIMLQCETADNITWGLYAEGREAEDGMSEVLREALTRVEFLEMGTPKPLHAVIGRVNEITDEMSGKQSRVLVMVGRSRRLAVENHGPELKEIMHSGKSIGREVKKTIGDVGTALVVSGVKAGVVVLQAANSPA